MSSQDIPNQGETPKTKRAHLTSAHDGPEILPISARDRIIAARITGYQAATRQAMTIGPLHSRALVVRFILANYECLE